MDSFESGKQNLIIHFIENDTYLITHKTNTKLQKVRYGSIAKIASFIEIDLPSRNAP
jgi:hypothetical protein